MTSNMSDAGDLGSVGTVGTTSPTSAPAPLGPEWTGPEGRRQINDTPRWTDSPELKRARAAADPTQQRDPAAGDKSTSGERYKFGDFELNEQEIRKLAAHKAVQDSRKATLPATPADYRLEMPPDFKPPPGNEFIFRESDPVLGPLITQAKALAHETGMDQATFSRWMALHAATQVNEGSNLARAAEAEVAKLGALGPGRVDAVTKWLSAVGGKKFSGLVNVIKYAPLASTVEGLEHLMKQMTTQGAGTYSRIGTLPPDNARIQNYEGMTFEQKRFAQDQARNQGRR
jgi:hypothetical protein